MDRRDFLALSGAGLLTLACGPTWGRVKGRNGSYSVVILGDTHYDAEPASVYHSNYMEKVDWLNKVQRAEFARNGEMWRNRCPRLVKRAARLVDRTTRMVLQVGDLVQGDCGSGEVHRRMLQDTMDYLKGELGPLPLVTVVGNHDIRGTKAREVYHDYMPGRMSEELGQTVEKTTFAFWIGRDAYLVIDFNNPDDAEVERLLEETRQARYTFVVVHGALFPMDSADCRWVYHGGDSEQETALRRRFRRLFAQRNAICLCGHTHTTEFYDWEGDGGRISQATMNSVWKDERTGIFRIDAEGPEAYGTLRLKAKKDDGSAPKDETALFDEYRPGLKQWVHSRAAGSYRMEVSPQGVKLHFYAGNDEAPSATFQLR